MQQNAGKIKIFLKHFYFEHHLNDFFAFHYSEVKKDKSWIIEFANITET